MARKGESFATRLYTGEKSIPFVRKRKYWYSLSAFLIVASIIILLVKGLSLGVDFKGGAVFEVPTNNHANATADARKAMNDLGVNAESITVLSGKTARIETKTLSPTESEEVKQTLSKTFDVKVEQVTTSVVGATWGGQITKKAFQGLIIFFVAVIIYLALRYEWRMSIAAFSALLHDLICTAGLYALVGFEVTPGTVIALLTILGYSLYDTVVVFDKVEEDVRDFAKGNRMTYASAANLGINQTLVRSINTTVISLLPVGSIFVIGYAALGPSGTLNDLSLALLIGLAFGSYSSLFIAPELVVDMKERQPQYRALRKRVEARMAGVGVKSGGKKTGLTAEPVEVPSVIEAGGTAVAADPLSLGESRTGVVPGRTPKPRKTSKPAPKGSRPKGGSGKKKRR